MIDVISGKKVSDTEEEKNVQTVCQWLLTLGYTREQIQAHPQYYVPKVNGKPNHRCVPVDIAVFRGSERTDADILMIVECKSSRSNHEGMDQLRRNLRATGAMVGLWFDGIELNVTYHVANAAPHMYVNHYPPASDFSRYIWQLRETLRSGPDGKRYTLRQVAKRIGVEPSYLSKIENGRASPPREDIIQKMAEEFNVDATELIARSGRVPKDMEKALLLKPNTLIPLLQALGEAPDAAILDLVRKVRDGKW